MDVENLIRNQFPLHLAKLYEAVCLEDEPRLRIHKLVLLYEAAVCHLALVGLALYLHQGLADEAVESDRAGLDRPSLGHWVALLRSLDAALFKARIPLHTPPISQALKPGPQLDGTRALAKVLGVELPKKVRRAHLLDTLVEFRNKKIGHGSLSAGEARQMLSPFESGLTDWLGGQNILHECTLLYFEKVSWQGDRFIYSGTNLNVGTSLYPASLPGQKTLDPHRVYLSRPLPSDGQELIPLYPFLAFDGDSLWPYVYSGLDNQGRPLLKCPYKSDAPAMQLDGDAAPILGAGSRPTLTSPQPAEMAKQPGRKKETTMIRSWYDIIPPHQDIRSGHFDEAVFAADLGDVASGTATADYGDAYLFLKKTYLTQGLRNLLDRVHQTLSTGQGSSVIQIQTPFGGGKTHALVAIYHYLKHGHQIKSLLPSNLELLSPHLAAVAGNHWNPVEGHTSGGITRRTFWGEIAYQIGGAAGYEAFRENDQAGISPGKAKLRDFLAAHQPCILLFDEILEYINRALDVRARTDVSLGTQTFSFFQELTEAVAAVPQCMLVVTLPSSYLEDFSEHEEESLARLNRIFGRVESIETPVQGEEVYAVIRRRLFEVEHLKSAQMREVVHRYFQLYQQHRNDLPPKARELNYREKMELAYPFHPDVIDILYEKWSTFSTFQRTRGVLRLLANVVEDLYQREASIDLILPGDINLDRPGIRQEFLKHIGPEYEGVIGSDIAGHEAKSQLLDSANKPWRHLAQRISTVVFYHSFSADDSTKGINLSYIKLAVLRSDTIPALVTDILGKLANTLWYLNSRGDAHYFSRIPNLNRMILDKKELFNQAYEAEMRSIVQHELGGQFRNYLWPENGDGIPDNRDLKLVLLHPEDGGAQIPEWIERRGNSFREYKNTLFFALADTGAFAKLRDDVKTVLALQDIKEEIAAGNSPLPVEKQSEVDGRLRSIKQDYSYNVRRMYHTLRIGDRTVDLGQPVAGRETLGNWFWRELTSSDVGAILAQLHYRIVVNMFMVNNDLLETGVLLDQFYKNLDLPAPSEAGVVARAIQLGVKDKAFGLVELRGDEPDPTTLKYGEDIPLDAVSFGPGMALASRVRCEELLAQIALPEVPYEPVVAPIPGTPGGDVGPIVTTPGVDVSTPAEERYQHIRLVIADIPASKIADVNRGILMPIGRATDGLRFKLEIDVQLPEGISKTTVENTIKETIRQIGARVEDEELE